MSYLTLKNLSALLLVGIMLFPIGINQSSAQTVMSTTVTAQTLDFMQHTAIFPPCITNGIFMPTPTGVSGVIHSLTGQQCFEGYTRTWQAFILNANDDNIIYSTEKFTTSERHGEHTISFDALTPSTDYRIITILTGSYTAGTSGNNPDPHVADTTVYSVTTFTTLVPSLVTANTHTVTLPDLFGHPMIDLPITDTEITDILLAGTTFGTSSLANIIFTTNGTGTFIDGAGGVVTSTGNASGAMMVTNPTSSSGPIFHYTPVSDFAGTEAFAYNATLGTNLGSSTLYIVVPAPVCEQDVSTAGLNFVVLGNGDRDDSFFRLTVANTGNTYNQPMIKGTDSTGGDWLSEADDTKIMDAEQTRYSVESTVGYPDKTPITSTNAIINNANSANVDRVKASNAIVDAAPLGENDQSISQFNGQIHLFMQLEVDLVDPTFEGRAFQGLTISSDCS